MTSQGKRFIYVNDKGWLKKPSSTTTPPKEYVFTDNLLDAYEFNFSDDKNNPDFLIFQTTLRMLIVWFGIDNVQVFRKHKHNDT